MGVVTRQAADEGLVPAAAAVAVVHVVMRAVAGDAELALGVKPDGAVILVVVKEEKILKDLQR